MARITRIGNTALEAMHGAVNSEQAILLALFGTEGMPESYDETKTYSKGEKIITLDNDGIPSIMVAKVDNITGEYDPEKWKLYTAGADSTESKAMMYAIYGSGELPDEYDPEKIYVVGSLCTMNGIVMKALTNTTGEYDPTKWKRFIAGDDSDDMDKHVKLIKLVHNNAIVSSALGI